VTNPEFPAGDFYVPGITSLRSEELNTVHDRAVAMLARLTIGKTTDLPEGMLHLLREHAQAINTRAIGVLRIQIAEGVHGMLAFDKQDAAAVAGQLEHLMKSSNEVAVNITLTDIIIAEQFRRIGDQQDDQNIA